MPVVDPCFCQLELRDFDAVAVAAKSDVAARFGSYPAACSSFACGKASKMSAESAGLWLLEEKKRSRGEIVAAAVVAAKFGINSLASSFLTSMMVVPSLIATERTVFAKCVVFFQLQGHHTPAGSIPALVTAAAVAD